MTLYFCETPDAFPYYVIMENQCIIPIHTSIGLPKYLEKEGFTKQNNHILLDHKFSVYNPVGPTLCEATKFLK